ncbi:hypothetical protein ACN9JG_06200 [Cereibacter azotoformans]|uniref:hypothetical protein n=1 Tax=Cereibacter azotoformans TaxID=43057 RepID=UPI003B21FBA1
MTVPQIIVALWIGFGVLHSIDKHGTAQRVDASDRFTSACLLAFLLWMGGFWA